MTTIDTYNEAVRLLITDTIEASGEAKAEEFDIDAIAAEVLVWDDAYDANQNVYRLDRQGWRLADDFAPEGSEDAFWAVVSSHELAEVSA